MDSTEDGSTTGAFTNIENEGTEDNMSQESAQETTGTENTAEEDTEVQTSKRVSMKVNAFGEVKTS